MEKKLGLNTWTGDIDKRISNFFINTKNEI